MGLKRKANGYIVACRLITVLTNGYRYGWKTHCRLFGPLVWDRLSQEQRQSFNQLAAHYRQSVIHKVERRGQTPTMYHFVNAVFLSTNESDTAADYLAPGAVALLQRYTHY